MPHRSTHVQVRSGNPTSTGADTAYEAEILVDSRDNQLKYHTNGAEHVIAGSGSIFGKELTFTETAVAGTYTGSVILPAGSTLYDIVVNGVALWTATTAVMKVGDGTDDDGYYTAVDLKATDLLAGESLSFSFAGGKVGAYIANSQVSPRYAVAARTIAAVVTTTGTGSAGRTRVTVFYSAPVAAESTAATKV